MPDQQLPLESPDGGMPQSEYTDLKNQLIQSATFLAKMTKLSPQSLRAFMVNDLYPLLGRFVENTEWYVMDLHTRLSDIESADSGSGLDEESGGRLIEFIGRTVGVFGTLMKWANNNNVALPGDAVTEMQLLVTSAPALMLMIQEMVVQDEEEGDEEYEDEEEGEYEDDEDDEPEGLVEPGSALEGSNEPEPKPPVVVEQVVGATVETPIPGEVVSPENKPEGVEP